MESFCGNKKVENSWFLANFGLTLAMFLTSQPYDISENAHKGPCYGVEKL